MSKTDFVTKFLYLLSCIFPRRKALWVFIGWHRTETGEVFTDNTKYFYLYIHNTHPEITTVWLAKSRSVANELQAAGLTAYYEFSPKGIYYALRAGVTVIDAYLQAWNQAFLGRSRLVQLLHGKGMKATGYSIPSRRQHDDICFPSSEVRQMISDDFIDSARTHITGYPRSDVILGKTLPGYEMHVDSNVLTQMQNLQDDGVKLIWYTPTFRRGQTKFDINNILDLQNLENLLQELDAYLFISLHPKYHKHQTITSNARVTFLNTQDFFPLYKYIDLLITDYSSTFADFLLLDRPIIFYPFDLDSYLKTEGFLIDYETETPGIKAYTSEQLYSAIQQSFKKDMYSKQRQIALRKYHLRADDQNSKRVYKSLTS